MGRTEVIADLYVRAAADPSLTRVKHDLGGALKRLDRAVYFRIAQARWHEQHPGYATAAKRRWRAANPEKTSDEYRRQSARRRARRGLPQRDGGLGRRAKLNWQQVAEIRRRYAAGERQTALAAEFGLTQGPVSQLVNGKSYRKAAA